MLPGTPPVAPMLARLARELPLDGYLYEPKRDCFRLCSAAPPPRPAAPRRAAAARRPELLVFAPDAVLERVGREGDLLAALR